MTYSGLIEGVVIPQGIQTTPVGTGKTGWRRFSARAPGSGGMDLSERRPARYSGDDQLGGVVYRAQCHDDHPDQPTEEGAGAHVQQRDPPGNHKEVTPMPTYPIDRVPFPGFGEAPILRYQIRIEHLSLLVDPTKYH